METAIFEVLNRTRIDPSFPEDCPLVWVGPPPSVMVHTHIIHKEYTPSNNDQEITWRFEERNVCFCSEIDLFIGNSRIENLSPYISSAGVASPYLIGVVNGIYQAFCEFAQINEPVEDCILNVTIEVVTIMGFIDDIERILMIIALAESIAEYERRMNYGMVPASTESLAMVEKRVKVEEKSDCTICLDGLDDYASAMPCKHMFHEDCILTWLKQSHYCPNCRFELPANNSLSVIQ